MLAELDEVLDRLSDNERQLIYMKHTQGMRCREIAEQTGKPLSTVTNALSRTYRKLQTWLTELDAPMRPR